MPDSCTIKANLDQVNSFLKKLIAVKSNSLYGLNNKLQICLLTFTP